MLVPIICPGCHTTYRVAQEQAGRSLRCYKCRTTFAAASAAAGSNLANDLGRSPRAAPPQRGLSSIGRLLIAGGIVGSVLLAAASLYLGIWLYRVFDTPEPVEPITTVP